MVDAAIKRHSAKNANATGFPIENARAKYKRESTVSIAICDLFSGAMREKKRMEKKVLTTKTNIVQITNRCEICI